MRLAGDRGEIRISACEFSLSFQSSEAMSLFNLPIGVKYASLEITVIDQ